jgi:putative ABC transport system permease protein
MAAFRENNIDRHTSLAFGVRHLVGSILIALALILGLLDFPGILYAIVRVSAPLPLFAGLMMVLRYILPPILQAFFIFWRKVFGVPGSLAVRSLLLRLDQTVITTGAIAISLSIAVGTLGMVQSMKATTFNWLDKARWADLLVFSFSGTEMEGSLLTDVLDYPFVKDVNPIRYFFISYDHPQLSDGGFLFQAVDPLPFQEFAHLEVVEGNTAEAMAALSRGPAILINEGLAQRLDLKQADVLSLTTNLGPVDFTIAGTVSDYSDFVHRMGKIVYGSYETLEKYWGVSGFTVLQIHITPLLSSENAKDRLWQGLSNQHDVKILTHEEEKADIGASIDSIFASTYGIVAAIGLIAVMGVFNTIFMNVLFQIREFAILKTLGLQTSQIRTMVFVEALTMACVGALFGLAAGVWIAGQVNLGIRELMGMVIQFHIPWTMMGGILLSLPLAAFLATLYPQRIACGLSIARVMQFSERL